MASNRLLFLVANSGVPGTDGELNGVEKDITAWRTFFMSPEGGAWKDDEIREYNNSHPLSYSELANILCLRRMDKSIDYCVFVFCGHGGLIGQDGETGIQLGYTDQGLCSISQLQRAFNDVKTLFILDSCRAWEECGETRMFSLIESVSSSLNNPNQCRQLYDLAVSNLPWGTHCIGYGASKNEFANEDPIKGGYYSQSLIEEAQKVSTNRNEQIFRFREVHNSARRSVFSKSGGIQTPELDGNGAFPFVVSPIHMLFD